MLQLPIALCEKEIVEGEWAVAMQLCIYHTCSPIRAMSMYIHSPMCSEHY